ncbi:amidase [Leeuwenhoekiella sp. A2]|uniref:amidase n=1 Tax=Leeuwenhoekiella sp. A2 TaxID=3141460 RepID=UPI003A7FE997
MKKLYSAIFTILTLLLITSCKSESVDMEINVEELTIAKIHEAYKSGEFTAEDLVNAYLNRIKELDTFTNAITAINPKAIKLAKQSDSLFKETGNLKPLQGIPILVKDNINVQGLPTTAGSLALQDYIPEKDAFIIKKLKDAGAIILAKTNMAEWAFSPMHTESSTAGTTHNPYNLDYVPAGSSGGTAAGVAANFAVIGLGTDTGNSIRGPSSHCDLVGFRTTLGLISRSAIVPLYLRNDVVGPMGRTVTDATKVLEVMAGYDPTDSITAHSDGNIPENYTQFLQKNGLKGAKIGVLSHLFGDDTDPEIVTLFNKAMKDIDSLGAEIIPNVVIPDFDELRQDQWCSAFKTDLENFLSTYVKNDTIKTIKDVIRIGTNSDFARQRLTSSAESEEGRYGHPETPCLDAYHDERRIAFREAIEKVMDSLQLDALVYPTWRNKPAHIANFQEEYKGDNSQIIAPHTGQPAFTVPMGFSGDNLPAGIQFLGRMFSEPTLIKLTYAYEQGTDHRKPPVIE